MATWLLGTITILWARYFLSHLSIACILTFKEIYLQVLNYQSSLHFEILINKLKVQNYTKINKEVNKYNKTVSTTFAFPSEQVILSLNCFIFYSTNKSKFKERASMLNEKLIKDKTKIELCKSRYPTLPTKKNLPMGCLRSMASQTEYQSNKHLVPSDHNSMRH